MASTTKLLHPLPAKPVSSPVIPLYPIVEEKISIPDNLWVSLKNWKSDLKYLEEECGYLMKILKWNNAVLTTEEGKKIFQRFKKMSDNDLPQLVASIYDLEKKIVSTLIESKGKIKLPYGQFQKLENQLLEYKSDISIVKLRILKIISHTTPITFF